MSGIDTDEASSSSASSFIEVDSNSNIIACILILLLVESSCDQSRYIKDLHCGKSQAKKAAKLASKAIAVPKAPIQRRTVKVVEKTDHGVACRTKVVAGQTNCGRAIIVPRRSL